ncbi:MAG: nickel pincer cofactor biosynthesis protein LarC, partial [Calditrichia bacterium]
MNTSKFLYIEAVGGISGDMLLAAFLDGLVPLSFLEEQLARLKFPGLQLLLEETSRHHIRARHLTVHSEDRTSRSLSQIISLIEGAAFSDTVTRRSIDAFQRLGKHEAEIHRIPLEKVHFHEVGAVDSIVDIVGAFICVDYLHPNKILTSPLPVSRGFVTAAHGQLPLPAPATLALLQDYPVLYRDIEAELVTPTGALLVRALSDGLFKERDAFVIKKCGYGAGSKSFREFPNLCRVWMGESEEKHFTEKILQVETNIDDMNPEFFPHLQNRLFKAGALDVTLYPGIMKKGRPGNLVVILSDEQNLAAIRDILYRESSTIGLRYFPVQREKLPRELRTINSPWGEVQVKVVWLNG